MFVNFKGIYQIDMAKLTNNTHFKGLTDLTNIAVNRQAVFDTLEKNYDNKVLLVFRDSDDTLAEKIMKRTKITFDHLA